MSRLRRSIAAAEAARNFTPRSASGISATMMSALKMTAERIADCGLSRCMTLRLSSAGNTPANIAGMMAKYLATSLAIENVVSDAAGDQQLLADLDDLDELRRVRVEVDHVAGLLGRLRAGVHRDADVGLRERGRVVGAVAGHRDELAARLLALDQRHLVLGRGLGEEVVDAGLVGDRRRGERVVAGDHHRADAHRAQLVEALAHARLDDVLEVDDAERAAVLGDDERGAARGRDAVDDRVRAPAGPSRRAPRPSGGPSRPRPCGCVRPSDVDAAHPGLGGERDELGAVQLAATEAVAAPSRARRSSGPRASRRRGSTSWAASASSRLGDARRGDELGRLPVAERDRAGLVEQQRRAVARRLDRAAATCEHVALHEPVHAGDADRREQRADRRRDQADEQRDEHDDGLLARRSRSANGCSVDGREQEDDREARRAGC